MKIEIGDYVRTYDGFIGKIKSIEPIEIGYNHYYFENTLVEKYDQDIMRIQKRPIDLIMEGDYANGYKVVSVCDDGVYIEIPFIDQESIGCNEDLIRIEEIETIVTKEQFERMMYNVR